MADDSPQPSPAAKDLLLEEYRNFSDSFWKNEQSGETRFNFFLGLVTAILAGLAAIAADGGLSGGALRAMVVAALIALVAVGVATFARILTRNESTDGYKRDSERVRQAFRDHFDPNHVLLHYHPFPQQDSKPEKKAEKKPEEKPEKKCQKRRKFGGLANIVAVINSVLAAACAAAVVFPFGQPLAVDAALFPMCVSAAAVFMLALAAQLTYARGRQEDACLSRSRCDPTHAGGVVYRRQGGIVEYLLVGPEIEVPNQWLFPKGHIERGEEHGATAMREVREETGVVAQPICFVDLVEYKVGDKEVRAKYYLMRELYEVKRTDTRRKKWFPFAAAQSLQPQYPETRYLLEEANRKLADYL